MQTSSLSSITTTPDITYHHSRCPLPTTSTDTPLSSLRRHIRLRIGLRDPTTPHSPDTVNGRPRTHPWLHPHRSVACAHQLTALRSTPNSNSLSHSTTGPPTLRATWSRTAATPSHLPAFITTAYPRRPRLSILLRLLRSRTSSRCPLDPRLGGRRKSHSQMAVEVRATHRWACRSAAAAT